MAVLVQFLDRKPVYFTQLSGRVFVIGRDKKGCQVTIPSPSVSRIHARIEIDPPHFYLRDVSRNGTLVNGRRVTGLQLLNDGDEIVISSEVFRFFLELPQDLSSQFGTDSEGNKPIELDTVDADDSIRHTLVAPGRQFFPQDDQFGPVPPQKIASILPMKADMSWLATSGDATRKLMLTFQCLNCLRRTNGEIDLLRNAVDHLRELFPHFDSIVVVRCSQNANRLDVVVTHSVDSTASAELGLPLVEQSIRNREAILMQDQWRNSSCSHPRINELTKHSLMCCPIVFSEEAVYGTIHLETGRTDFSPDRTDLERLVMFTYVLAICLEQSLHAAELASKSALDRSTEMGNSFRASYSGAGSPEIPGYLLRRFMISAPNVAADLVEFIALDENRTAAILIDVPGRSAVTSSLIACLSHLMTDALKDSGSPAQAIRSTEQTLLARKNHVPPKLSLAVAVLDRQRGTVVVSVSGQCSIFTHDGRKASQLNHNDITDTGHGTSRNDYRETEIPLNEGSSLLLLNDGVSRLISSAGQSLSQQELLELIEPSLAEPPDAHLRIADQLQGFRSGAPLQSDIVFMMIHRNPTPPSVFEPSPLLLDSPETR
ncbi:MAG: FHA domain-containing protein [Planctomyces sp.]|nr:FHA domain-containing protein [Planctomyces sp.]